jgi:2-polyprenyl-6-methoxyphenol hydroxylase-like FAD-dependent oxidoreductase
MDAIQNQNILISGASVAGPALAWWLARHGFRPTVVERAPHLRGGGYAVDFRGAAHLSVLAQMGLLEQVEERQTHLSATTYVDGDGRPTASMPPGTGLHQDDAGVHVTFARSAPRTFDLVIGADGLHSGVRTLAFAGQPDPVTDLGLYVAIFSVPDRYGLDHEGLLYSTPGKTASVFSAPRTGQAVAQFFFAAPGGRPLDFDYRDPAQQQKIVAGVFADVGWHVPDLLGQMPAADDFYFDSVSQVQLDRWSAGRVALTGDAGYAAGPGGNGTGTAVVAAYVLAGELAAAGGDYRVAYDRYERLLRPYVARGQKQARGGADFLAPPTEKKIAQRDRFFRLLPYLPPARALVKHLSTRTATAIKLPEYV